MKTYRILVVDDEPAVRRALERALTRQGHVVYTANSGEEACDLLRAQSVDAILMDLRMPKMSGQTLFHMILAEWPELVPRVAVMSGDPEAEDQQEWLRIYHLPVIEKPFELAQVFGMIELLTTEERRQANGT
ncbi:MAG: response regulator [Gemmatimonadetes bacterium]|nr:response regulator [Gemmatimonadota bacterium]